ncbi:MAG: HisA/HisF-related TIM barrel protein, partial [Promicromonosporaceae bacterium]|nr:HisA/HisF-related TIM barrel protein [Promicromonosporaceae bacterium]
ALVVAIDGAPTTETPSGFEGVTHGGSRRTGIDAISWAEQVQERGAGAILLTSLDADGTQDGFDLAPLGAISTAVGIPVIASGGAGTLTDFVEAARAGAGAVLAASVFHFGTFTIAQVKEALRAAGFATS